MADIKANPDKPWCWDGISRNPNLTMEMINANPDKPWDWDEISRNSNITMADIKANPDKPWCWDVISRNPNITMDYITDNPGKPWDWNVISINSFTRDKQEFIAKRYHEYLAAYRIPTMVAQDKARPSTSSRNDKARTGISRII